MKVRVVNPTRLPNRSARRARASQARSGGVYIVAKRRNRSYRRRSRRIGSSHPRRRQNPSFGFGRVHHRRHRRRNPAGFSMRDVGAQLLWGTAGGVAALTVPGLVLSSMNSGFVGYILNGATAWLGSMAVSKIGGPKAGQDFFVGGLVATGMRIFNNFFGSSFPIGLNFYIPNSFPLPTTGSGPYLLNPGYEGSTPQQSIQAGASPAAIAAAAAAAATTAATGGGTMSGSSGGDGKWSDRWAA